MRLILSALMAFSALYAMRETTDAARIFVTNFQTGTISEYTTFGETVNPRARLGAESPGRHRVLGRKFVCYELEPR